MAQSFFPFDTSAVLEGEWQKMARHWAPTGVAAEGGSGYRNLLKVTASAVAMQVTMDTGGAFVHGFWYDTDAAVVLTVTAANATNPRVDTVVLEMDRTANTITPKVIAGTPAASPVAPTLTLTDTLYQMPLYDFTVPAAATTLSASVLTDRRSYSEPNVTSKVASTTLGPAAQTDFSAEATVVSLNYNLPVNRKFKLVAYVSGTQITTGGVVVARLKVGSTEVRRPFSGNKAVNEVFTGESSYILTGTGSPGTASITIQATAGAARVLANACELRVEDMGY